MAKKVTRRGHRTAQSKSSGAIVNRRARFDYELGDTVTVGLELTGAETKAARLGHIQLRGSYVVPKINIANQRAELFLINASFSLATNVPKHSSREASVVDTRARKVLAKRREIVVARIHLLGDPLEGFCGLLRVRDDRSDEVRDSLVGGEFHALRVHQHHAHLFRRGAHHD